MQRPVKCPNPNDLGDGVDQNDKPFLSTFPYLAEPDSGFDSHASRRTTHGSDDAGGGLAHRGPLRLTLPTTTT